MMVMSEEFIREFEGKNYKELLETRESLLARIRDFEEKGGEGWNIEPSADVVYQMNLEYLARLCLLIADKYNEEYVWGE